MPQLSRMLTKVRNGQLSIGPAVLTPGQDIIEVLGYAGVDFVAMEFSLTPVDWAEASSMVRAARQYGITPWIHLQSYPWTADPEAVDPGVMAQAVRALAIGAECVTASLNTPEQVAALINPGVKQHHRRDYIFEGLPDASGLQRYYDDREAKPLLFPTLESATAADNLEEIMNLEGLEAVYFGMGDLSNELGHPWDDRHPEVRAFVKDAVKLGQEKGVMVFANVIPYREPQRDHPDWIADGVAWLWDAGVRAVWIPHPAYIVQRHYHRVLSAVREQLGEAYPDGLVVGEPGAVWAAEDKVHRR